MNTKFLIPLAVFAVIVLLLGLGLTLNPRAIPSTMLNKPAPEFSLPLLSNEQQFFSPKELIGQRWILNVWASWCVSCRHEHPLLNQLANSGVTIVGLNYKDEPEKATKWLAERGNPYAKSPLDTQGRAGIEWGVIAVPETFIIDEAGMVVYKHTGPINADIVSNELLPALNLQSKTTR